MSFVDGGVVGVEFNRDVLPLINDKCISCHTIEGSANNLVLDGSSDLSAYLTIKTTGKPEGGGYTFPQKSRYIRTSQARESLLAWVVWGERLDGRTNDTRDSDIDYTDAIHSAHSNLILSDYEKRTIARWIDLGSPIDFPQTDGMGYTDDNQLPIINLKVSEDNKTLSVGVIDAHSGIDWSSLKVSYYPLDIESAIADSATAPSCSLQPKHSDQIRGVNHYSLSLNNDKDYMIEVKVLDLWGNKNIATKKVVINNE